MNLAPLSIYIAEGLSFGACIIALLTIAGYMLGIQELYTWNVGVGMALPTACGMFMNGAAIFILAFNSYRKR